MIFDFVLIFCFLQDERKRCQDLGQLVEAARLEGIAQQNQLQEIAKENVGLCRKIEEQDEAFKQLERSRGVFKQIILGRSNNK